jgi:pseudaminic acid biosynthesis-associated methylase
VTPQTATWTGEFGRAYTDRNLYSPNGLDDHYQRMFGVTRSALNAEFLADVPREARILEVGCNAGNQLLALWGAGFSNLTGLEIQPYAAELARARVPGAEIVVGSALELPFPDGAFDLVVTNGVLIHIAPSDLPRVLSEIVRCSRALVWGAEYYSPEPVEVNYRGHTDLLWKRDFAAAYRALGLVLRRERRLSHADGSGLVDAMFLLARAPHEGAR